jgi:hypothetical protein
MRAARQMAQDPRQQAVAMAVLDVLVSLADGDVDTARLVEAGFWSEHGAARAVGECAEALIRAAVKLGQAMPVPEELEGDQLPGDVAMTWLSEQMALALSVVEHGEDDHG